MSKKKLLVPLENKQVRVWSQAVAFLLIVLLIGLTWLALNGCLARVDRALTDAIYEWRSLRLTSIMNFISLLGEQVIAISSVLISTYFLFKKRWFELSAYLLLVGGEEVLNLLLKALIARPRPDYLPLVHETNSSFPSGHAMGSIVFYGTLAFWLWQKKTGGKYRYVWFFLAALITIAVGISRIYLGAHYPSDVLAGFIAGAAWMLIILTSIIP